LLLLLMMLLAATEEFRSQLADQSARLRGLLAHEHIYCHALSDRYQLQSSLQIQSKE
jgi:hypothetical protein